MRKLDDFGALSLRAVDEFKDGGLHPGYAFPLWHGVARARGEARRRRSERGRAARVEHPRPACPRARLRDGAPGLPLDVARCRDDARAGRDDRARAGRRRRVHVARAARHDGAPAARARGDRAVLPLRAGSVRPLRSRSRSREWTSRSCTRRTRSSSRSRSSASLSCARSPAARICVRASAASSRSALPVLAVVAWLAPIVAETRSHIPTAETRRRPCPVLLRSLGELSVELSPAARRRRAHGPVGGRRAPPHAARGGRRPAAVERTRARRHGARPRPRAVVLSLPSVLRPRIALAVSASRRFRAVRIRARRRRCRSDARAEARWCCR